MQENVPGTFDLLAQTQPQDMGPLSLLEAVVHLGQAAFLIKNGLPGEWSSGSHW